MEGVAPAAPSLCACAPLVSGTGSAFGTTDGNVANISPLKRTETMPMRKLVVLPIVVLLVALSMVQTAYAADTYTDPQGQISFTPPDGYQQFSAQEINQIARLAGTIIGAPGRTAALKTAIITGYRDPLTMANFIVAATPLSTPDVSLDDVVQANRDQLANIRLTTVTPSDIQDAMIGNEAARSFEYTLMAGSVNVHGRQYYIIHNDALYLITLSAPEDNADQAFGDMQVVLDSFMFLQ